MGAITLMNNSNSLLSPENAAKIKKAIQGMVEAAQELGNILDDTGYQLSKCTPEFMADFDDFSYDMITWCQDEKEEIDIHTLAASGVHSEA
jgi:hypothetical protein